MMRIRRIAGVMSVVLAVAAVAGAGGDCPHTAALEAVVDAQGAAIVRIKAGAGFLHVVGRAGLEEVQAMGTACASDEKLVGKIEIDAHRRGDEVVIETRIPDRAWRGGTARLDLTVEMPESLAVRIWDGSGEMEVSGVASAWIEDGSGEVHITDIAGDLTVKDGSGEILVTDIAGNVTVDDGSGEIRVERAMGDVTLEDGSGEITVLGVEGSVRVLDDSSGDIRAEDVGGDFVVEDDGSGDIVHRGVIGRVRVPDED